MNTNTIKLTFVTLLAHMMCMTVVLSHAHAKDAVSFMNQYGSATKLVSTDITAKALGDLHHHIDKASVKNPHATTNAARIRKLNPLEEDMADDDLRSRFHDFLLRLRVVLSLCVQYA
jgi:hypothetical protein